MLKFLRTFAMAAAMMLPFAMQAQDCTTAIAVTSSSPFEEGFEGGSMPSCWTTDGSGTWSVATGDYSSSTGAHTGTYNAKITHGSTGNTTKLITPVLDMSAMTAAQLSFWHVQRSWAGDYDGLTVYYRTSTTGEWTELEDYSTSAYATWTEEVINLTTLSATFQIAFEMTDEYGYGVGLDDITIAAPPSCIAATGLTVSAVTSESVTLSWTSDATNFDIYDMTTHSMVGSSTTNSYTVENLDANTAYTFGVVVNCGGGDYSDTVSVSGRTACVAITIDANNLFSEGFEGTTFPPDCWSTAHTAGSATSLWTRYTSTVHAGSGSAQLPDQQIGNKTNLVTPLLDIPEANAYMISFWINRVSGSKPNEGVKVWVNTTPDTVGGTALMHIRRAYSQGTITEEAAGWYKYSAAIPTSGDVYIIFEGISEYGNYTLIDDIAIEVAPSCLPVTNLAIDATQTTSSSLTLTWTSDATNFVIVNMADSSQVGTSSTNSYTVEGLNANTAYTFGVVVDCGGETSDTIIVSGRTACGIIASLPWSDNLESVPSGSNPMPFCWSRYNNLTTGYSYYPYNTNSSSYAHGGNYSLYWYYGSYGTYADTAIAILPQLDVTTYPMNGNQLSFWGRMSTSTQSITVYVGTMSDPEDVTTFTTSGTVTVSGATHTRYDVNLSEANATDAYAAIMVLKPTGSASLYIDDVMLHEAPSCAYITGLTVTGATAESISLSWVDGDNTDATYSVYVVTPSDTTLVASNIADTAYTVEDLDANTAYVFGVVANCAGGDAEMVIVSGRTACVAFTIDADNPFTEGFEGTTFPPDCWSIAHTAGSSTNTWIRNTSTSSVHTGSASAQLQDQQSGNKNNLVTPVLNIPEANGYQVSFWIYRSTTSYTNKTKEGVKVWVNTNPDTVGGTPLMHIRRSATQGEITETATGWYQYSAVIPTSGEMYVIFEGISEYGASTYIDDIAIEVAPSCLAPTGLAVDATQTTSESITLSWVSDGSSFVVLNMADTTVAATVSDTTATIENLTANTSYTFGVVNDCGSETSDTVMITVRTACGAITLPYTEDFESGIDCWSMVSCATNTNVQSTYPYSGTKSFKFAYNTNPPQYLISPELEGGEDGVQVSLMYRVGGNYTESFALGYSTTTNEVSAFTWLTEQTGLTNQTYEAYTDYMPAGTKYVAVKYTANDQLALYIDSMVFSPVDAGFCFPVTGLTVDTASANEVTISWSGDAANYSIYNGTTYVGSTADTFYTVNGLTASTEYTFGVTAVCSATDSADMVTVSARTDCEGGSCNITIASASNGLVGASIDVMQNGSLVANVTDASYAPFSTAVSVCANVPVTLVYHQTPYASYGYDEYVSFTVSDGAGTVLYTCAEGDGVALTEGQTLLTIANACPTCLPVTDLAVDTVETTSVTISWSGTAASYNVYNGTTYVATVSTNSYTFTGLSAAMNYTFGVVALCDDEDSSAMATIVASTECGIISTFPYTQAFESAPACWATIDADADGFNWENLQGAMHSASYDNTEGVLTPDNWLITPQFQLGAGNSYEVTWNANPQDASYPAEHYGLYVSTNSTIDTANFTMLQEWTLTSAGNTPVVDLSAYSGQTIYLALRHWNCTDQYRIAIDNFELREQAGANQVTITLSQNNPMYGSVAGGGVYTIGDNVTVTATPSAGYQFSKWINSASVTVSTDNPYTFVASTDTALQAVFVSAAATTYDVVVTVNDSTMGTATGSGTYTSGDVVVMTATANPGYHFVNWTQNNTVLSTNNPFSMSATSNTAAYPIIANFEADMVETPTYTVTVNVNDATMGHVDGVPTAAVDSGAVVALTAVPESGYHFVSWSNGLTTAAISLVVTSDTTVTATFEANPANTYTVAVSVNDAAMGHVDGIPTEPVTAGTVVNLTAVADAGYHFVDWSNGLTTAAISITVTSDTTLVANFEADPVEPTYYTVTVVYDATMGTVDGIPTEPVTSDDDITLTARANEGYVFKGWVIGTDTMSTESTYTFNATDDVTIEAVFAAKTGIADVDMADVKVYSVNDVIYVNGAEGHQVYLFDVNGRVLSHSAKAGEHVEFRVANTGVYLVKVGNAAAKRVVVAR